jgi:hypothetical protein
MSKNKRTDEVQVGTRWRRIHNRQTSKVIALNPNGTVTLEIENWERRRDCFFPSFVAMAFDLVL